MSKFGLCLTNKILTMKKRYNKMDLWQLEIELKVNEKLERYERCAEIRDIINLIKEGEYVKPKRKRIKSEI